MLANPGGIVVDGKGLQAWELVLWPAAPVEGEVDLRNAVLEVAARRSRDLAAAAAP